MIPITLATPGRLLKVDKREIGHIYLYALVGGAISLSLPLGVQAIINLISGGQVATSWGAHRLVTIGVGFTGALQVMQLALAENIQQRLFARSALEFAYRLPRIHHEAAGGRYLPELVNRFFDTISVQKAGQVAPRPSVAALRIVLCIILLAIYHPFFIVFGISLAAARAHLPLYRKAWIGHQPGGKHPSNAVVFLGSSELGRSQDTFKMVGTTDLPIDRTDTLVDYVGARRKHFRVLLGQYSAMVVFKVIVTLGLLVRRSARHQRTDELGPVRGRRDRDPVDASTPWRSIILNIAMYDVLTALEKIGQVTDIELERTGGLTPLSADPNKGLDVRAIDLGFTSKWNERSVLAVDQLSGTGEKA